MCRFYSDICCCFTVQPNFANAVLPVDYNAFRLDIYPHKCLKIKHYIGFINLLFNRSRTYKRNGMT